MKNLSNTISLAALLLVTTGCPDPVKDAPKAKVSEATAKPASKPASPPANPAAAGAEGTAAAAKPAGDVLPIDAAASVVGFVGAKVTSSEAGTFPGLSGAVTLNAAALESSQIKIEIDVASVQTEKEKLTNHLKSDDFFDAPNHPKARFSSTKIVKGDEPDGYTVTGDLEIRGVAKSVTFPATITLTEAAVTAKAKFGINRMDWGIAYPGAKDNLIKDEVLLNLVIVAKR